MRTNDSNDVKLLSFDTEAEQYIEIAKLISASKTNFNDIVVLYRNNSTANEIELALKTLNIETIRDDRSSFDEINEVRYALNLLRLISSSDELSFFETHQGVKVMVTKKYCARYSLFFVLPISNLYSNSFYYL